MISLEEIDQVIQSGPLNQPGTHFSHQVCPQYRDAKFGTFIHWGVYSVPAFGSNGIREICISSRESFACTYQ